MLFHSETFQKEAGEFRFAGKIKAQAHPCLARDIFAELFSGYAFRQASLAFDTCEDLMLSVGGVLPPALDGEDYAIRIEKEGFALSGATERDLIHAFFTLADRIRAEETETGAELCLDCGVLRESARIKMHITANKST